MKEQILKEAVIRAIVIRETFPIGEKFDKSTLQFLQDLFLWRRPEKFLFNGNATKFVSGQVSVDLNNNRTLQFRFDNGYVWMASLKKAARKSYKKYLIEACSHIDCIHSN